MIRATRFAAAAAMLAVVAACGTTDVGTASRTPSAPASQTCADDTTTTSTGPVTMTDGVGRTVKLAKPAQRVAVLEWQQTEDVLTLCLTPVAVAEPKGYGTYVKAEPLPADVVNAGDRGTPDLDALYATNPDLIIVEAFKADDEVLTKLAERGMPVLATVGADATGQIANMKRVFSMIAEATGRTEWADRVLKQFDQHLAAAKQQAGTVKATGFLFFDGWIEGGNVVIR